MTFEEIVEEIRKERAAQDAKWGVGFFGRSDAFWLTILAEEFGEIANAIIEGEEEHTEDELVQAAAVIFSWLEFRTPYGHQPSSSAERGLSGRRTADGGVSYE